MKGTEAKTHFKLMFAVKPLMKDTYIIEGQFPFLRKNHTLFKKLPLNLGQQ